MITVNTRRAQRGARPAQEDEMTIAHVGHAELRVTDLQASRAFFTDVMGLFVTAESDHQVYLRAWQDFDHHTLLLTQAEDSGLGHLAWRVSGPEDLADHEHQLRSLGVEYEWIEGGTELGHGDALRFRTPSAGIPTELYWEVERYVEADPSMVSNLASHPQRYIGRGIAPRRFDHANFLVNDVRAEQQWHSEHLGIRHNYYLENAENERLGSWLAKTNLSHEIAFMRNRNQDGDVLHHIAYYLDSPDQLLRAATIIADGGAKLEWGPGQHGTSGAIFLYCFEPSGNRIEVWTGGMLLFAPDWEPIRWDADTAAQGLEMWDSVMPETYLTHGTSLAPRRAAVASVA
jgi:catechol 2,3-dioxygenase